MPPKEGSRKYKAIVKLGCGGYFDYYGEFDCGHYYEWECDYCPCCIEYHRLKRESGEEIIDKLDIDIDDFLKRKE